jgi:hypothetical protein
MAMDKGSITINGDGSATGSGLAKELYDVHLPKVDFGVLVGAETVTAKQQLADLFETISEVVTHITTNGKAVIDTGDSGLQRIPATPVSEDDDCKAPGAKKTLAIE